MSRRSRLPRPLPLIMSVCWLSLCGPAPVLAAPPANAEKTYRIEAIVFAQPANTDAEERWPTAAALPPALDTVTPTPELPADGKLLPALQALKSPPYRVLAQASWTQVAADKAATKPVALHSADGALDGTVVFYVSRFLHSEINLRWRGDMPADAPAAIRSTTDTAPANVAAPARTAAAPVFYLSERRRIRTAETHYFDHPKFGVLLRVTPL